MEMARRMGIGIEVRGRRGGSRLVKDRAEMGWMWIRRTDAGHHMRVLARIEWLVTRVRSVMIVRRGVAVRHEDLAIIPIRRSREYFQGAPGSILGGMVSVHKHTGRQPATQQEDGGPTLTGSGID